MPMRYVISIFRPSTGGDGLENAAARNGYRAHKDRHTHTHTYTPCGKCASGVDRATTRNCRRYRFRDEFAFFCRGDCVSANFIPQERNQTKSPGQETRRTQENTYCIKCMLLVPSISQVYLSANQSKVHHKHQISS